MCVLMVFTMETFMHELKYFHFGTNKATILCRWLSLVLRSENWNHVLFSVIFVNFFDKHEQRGYKHEHRPQINKLLLFYDFNHRF